MLIAAVSSRVRAGRAMLALRGTGIMRAMTPAAPAPIGPRMVAAWAGFCLVMLLVGLQERWYAGQALWPWPVLYESSSMGVASGVAVWRWRRNPQDDPWLGQPARWFWRVLRWTPLVALAFIGAL
jgi:hypothetical protein